MPEDDSSPIERLAKSLEKVLNSHGYGFQYSLLRQAERLALDAKSFWMPSVVEFPVEVQEHGTRIDIVLQHRMRPFYILAECKRANPALANWCFAKSPYVPIIQSAMVASVEAVRAIDNKITSTSTRFLSHSDNIYHVAIEVKGKTPGDMEGHGHGEIEQAATQICRGLNGMLDFFALHPSFFEGFFGKVPNVGFLPVIFTTARLWSTTIDLGSADLATGNVALKADDIKEVPWLFYHYNQSPGLKHSLNSSSLASTLQEVLYSEYVRTIAVVSASGVTDFLCSGIFA